MNGWWWRLYLDIMCNTNYQDTSRILQKHKIIISQFWIWTFVTKRYRNLNCYNLFTGLLINIFLSDYWNQFAWNLHIYKHSHLQYIVAHTLIHSYYLALAGLVHRLHAGATFINVSTVLTLQSILYIHGVSEYLYST